MPMEPASDLLAVRRHKLDALRAAGVAPFGEKFEVKGSIGDVVAAFSEGQGHPAPAHSRCPGCARPAGHLIIS